MDVMATRAGTKDFKLLAQETRNNKRATQSLFLSVKNNQPKDTGPIFLQSVKVIIGRFVNK